MVSDGGGNGPFLSWMPLKAKPETKVIYLEGDSREKMWGTAVVK